MKKLVSNYNWILIVILAAVTFLNIRTFASDGAIQSGEIFVLVSIIASIILTWFIVKSEWWKGLNQRYNISRYFFILLILAIVIGVAIYYVFFGGF